MNLKKYELLNEGLKAIFKRVINLLILRGESGFGKTFTTLKYAKKNKLNYKYINNYTTPLSFYQILYENRKRDVIILDDLQNINDMKIKSILKSACWESDKGKRIINYYSNSSLFEKNNLPESFELEARIILIFNEELNGFESIVDRGVLINFNFNFNERIKILESFREEAGIDKEVLEYVKANCNEATKNLSLRTLIILSKIKAGGYPFKLFAEEMLVKDEMIEGLMTLSVTDWCHENGKSKRTYYRRKKQLLNQKSAKVPKVPKDFDKN